MKTGMILTFSRAGDASRRHWRKTVTVRRATQAPIEKFRPNTDPAWAKNYLSPSCGRRGDRHLRDIPASVRPPMCHFAISAPGKARDFRRIRAETGDFESLREAILAPVRHDYSGGGTTALARCATTPSAANSASAAQTSENPTSRWWENGSRKTKTPIAS